MKSEQLWNASVTKLIRFQRSPIISDMRFFANVRFPHCVALCDLAGKQAHSDIFVWGGEHTNVFLDNTSTVFISDYDVGYSMLRIRTSGVPKMGS